MEKRGTEEQHKESQGKTAQSRNLMRSEGMREATLLPFASPFSFMRRLMEDLDDIVSDGRRAGAQRPLGMSLGFSPPLEVLERDNQLIIRAEVPGVTKDQLRVDIEDGQLVISGERKHDFEEKKGDVYRSEHSYGRFSRVVALPEGTDIDQAKASFSNGVLEITLPAPSRARRGKSLEIADAPQAKPAH
jgi:HSP20 family protein